ncbi:MAG: hypothetical protein ACRD3G_16115 [Vicinamibacterales bacterium]
MTRALLLLAMVLFWAGSAAAATFQICVKIDILTTDSGLTANGVTEDKWVGANDPIEYLVTGRGFRVKVRQGSWVQTFDTHPETGCISFERTASTGFDVRVYGFATDSGGNHVRIHDAGLDTSSWYPGATYSQLFSNQTLSPFGANMFVLPGRASDIWTTIAAAAYGLYRYHDGNSGKTLSIGFAEGNCSNTGSIHGNAENFIESKGAHLLRIGRCAGTSTDARQKMIVTHEMGHAMLRLYYGFDGDDQPRDQGYDPPASIPTGAPPQGTNCINEAKYDMNSLEWNSQTFKESYAEFYSAKVWNVKAARGTYVSRGTAYDLEKWDNVGDVNTFGGFTLNFCSSTEAGVTTMGDTLRFLWDFYTIGECGAQPTRLDMMKVYRAVRLNHKDGTFALTDTNYGEALEYAIENSVSSLSACEQGGYDKFAAWNGVS